MNWYGALNDDTDETGLLVSQARIFELNDGNQYILDLPYCGTAQPEQAYFVIANISNMSSLVIRSKDYSGHPGNILRTVTNSSSIYLLFDGTSTKWRIVSDDKIMSIEDADNPLTALSGNKVKDQDGNLINQSGVDVVGINSINGKTPLLSGDDITVGNINGYNPVLQGGDASLNEVSANSITCSSLTVNNITSTSIQRYEVDNSAAGYFYNAVDTFYGLPVFDGDIVNVNIDAVSFISGVGRVYHLNGIYKENGVISTLGYYITDYGNPARITQTVSETSTPLSDCSTIYFYV